MIDKRPSRLWLATRPNPRFPARTLGANNPPLPSRFFPAQDPGFRISGRLCARGNERSSTTRYALGYDLGQTRVRAKNSTSKARFENRVTGVRLVEAAFKWVLRGNLGGRV